MFSALEALHWLSWKCVKKVKTKFIVHIEKTLSNMSCLSILWHSMDGKGIGIEAYIFLEACDIKEGLNKCNMCFSSFLFVNDIILFIFN